MWTMSAPDVEVTLRGVTGETLWAILQLEVLDEQK
jgi:hypothetical protein